MNDRGCAIALTAPASPNPPQFTGGDSNCQTLGLSGSILHEKTGLFVTGGYGIKWDHNRNASFQGVTEIQAVGGTGGNIKDSDDFYFVNAGIEKKFDEFGLKKLGRTTLYGEWEHYDTGGIIGGSGLTATARPRTFTASSGFNDATIAGASRFSAGADIDVLRIGVNQNTSRRHRSISTPLTGVRKPSSTPAPMASRGGRMHAPTNSRRSTSS